MADPQGLFSFPGLDQIVGGSFTLSHGVSPSSAVIQIAPQPRPFAGTGTLKITFGSTLIEFPDCRVNNATANISQSGTVVSLQVLDRRWKWRFGCISGRYNLRKKNEELDQKTEKTPQELAKLLLEEMGESGFDVSKLPNRSRPQKEWLAVNPANELATLCDELGCRVVLGLDNRVRIELIGGENDLPNGGEMTESYGVDPADKPDSLKLTGGPTRYQAKFVLEAVGLDTDDSIKPIDELSYRPAGGWQDQFPDSFDNVEEDPNAENEEDKAKPRKLALQSVFRWYRILWEINARQGVFENPDVAQLEQILPIEDVLVETFQNNQGVEKSKPAFVEGVRWEGGEGFTNSKSRTTENFSIDKENGIVKFSKPVYKLEDEATISEAELTLTCAFSVRGDDRLLLRFTRERSLPGPKFGTGPQVLRRDEVVQTVILRYDKENNPLKDKTNLRDLEKEADFYLDAAGREFERVDTSTIEYAGIVPIALDGKIHQVTFSVGLSGAKTSASTNTEHNFNVPNYKERRRREQEQKRRVQDNLVGGLDAAGGFVRAK